MRRFICSVIVVLLSINFYVTDVVATLSAQDICIDGGEEELYQGASLDGAEELYQGTSIDGAEELYQGTSLDGTEEIYQGTSLDGEEELYQGASLDGAVKEPEQCLSIDGAVKESVSVTSIDFARPARNIIQIVWGDSTDDKVSNYLVYRRKTVNSLGTGNWELLATIKSDGMANGVVNRYNDVLKSTSPQQYEYTVVVQVSNSDRYTAEIGKTVIASNIKVCIDPGHYTGKNTVEEKYPYCEGDFTLSIATALYKELRKYGISASFTRTTPNIVINGMVNEGLDTTNISLRGEFVVVEDCNLFVSLHTNANGENAHGYPTFMQPISMNNPIVIVNIPATKDQSVLNMATSIGTNLVNTNYSLGISSVRNYVGATVNNVPGWTNSINDELSISGLTLCRFNSKGTDYYGVLRGAANVNVPGMIIEHGFHTVPEMRQAAAGGKLHTAWAKADAYGIAYGYGFVSKLTY